MYPGRAVPAVADGACEELRVLSGACATAGDIKRFVWRRYQGVSGRVGGGTLSAAMVAVSAAIGAAIVSLPAGRSRSRRPPSWGSRGLVRVGVRVQGRVGVRVQGRVGVRARARGWG